MKHRIYDRLLFFGLGALVAFIGFLFGNLRTDINAAPELEDSFYSHTISARNFFLLDSRKRPVVNIAAHTDGTQIMLTKYDKNNKEINTIRIAVEDERAFIDVGRNVGLSSNNSDGSVSVQDKDGNIYTILPAGPRKDEN
ncbi:hypothetical protein F4X73_12415 [Candidatus Poribacteria bacterium]|nr:hypothetical protein [Candidatus Poribacteria bacterium]